MAIKAIINNTEKEIEQIKNSDEQDIDYVYSRIGDTEVEGEPPISIKSIGGELADYRIYGNTVDGESVGDRTGNLFDENSPEIQDGIYVDNSGTFINSAYHQLSPYITCIANYTYRLYMERARSSVFTVYVNLWDSNKQFIKNLYVTQLPSEYQTLSISFTPSENGFITFNFLNNSGITKNVMFYKGSTTLPYEPYGYKVPVTVEGKNLLQNTATSQTINGITFTVNTDGSITCSGIPTSGEYADSVISGVFLGDTDILENGNYIVSCANANNYASLLVGNSEGEVGRVRNAEISISANLTWAMLRIRQADPAITLYPMIRKADIEDDTYEPYHAPVTTSIYLPEPIKMVGDEAEYIDYGEQKQHRVRKNLLLNTATSQTINGVTFTVNNDGSVTCNGTASATIDYRMVALNSYSLPAGNYRLTGAPPTANFSSYYLRAWDNSSGSVKGVIDIGNGTNFSLTDTTILLCAIIIASQQVLNNVTFYPMIRKASIEDDTYEPYIENTDVDVTLPALSTIKGTNTFSVNTSIQPSNIYIKDNFDYKKVFTATRAIEDELPLNYKNIEDNDSTLKNYRIYGNTVGGESVGDLVESGQHAGEYAVPVTVEGKNLLQNTTRSQTFGGVMVTVNSDGSMTCNGTAITHATLRINIGEIPSGIYKLSGCPKNGAYNTYRLDVRDSSDAVIVLDTGNGHLFNSTNAHHVELRIENGYTCDNLTFYPMIRKADITDDTYEPYHAPVTTPIYLPEPIKMVGDEAEYIDYAEQKMHRVRVNLSEINEFSNSTTDTANMLYIWIQQGKNQSFGYPSQSNKFDITEPTTITTNITITNGNDSIRIKHNGFTRDIVIDIVRGLSPGVYSVSFNILNYDHTTVGGVVINNIMLNKGSTALPYEPYIENTDINVTLPALPTLTGTNVLSVGTAVQPSEVEIKGKIKEIN